MAQALDDELTKQHRHVLAEHHGQRTRFLEVGAIHVDRDRLQSLRIWLSRPPAAALDWHGPFELPAI